MNFPCECPRGNTHACLRDTFCTAIDIIANNDFRLLKGTLVGWLVVWGLTAL